MGGRTPHEGPSFPRVEVTGITLTKTRQTDSAAWDFFVAHCEAEGITIREAGSGTIAAAMTAYADAATSTLLDEIKARVSDALHAASRCLLPIHMGMAQAECVDEPMADDAVVLSFMGSGASDFVTAGEVRKAMSKINEAIASIQGRE